MNILLFLVGLACASLALSLIFAPIVWDIIRELFGAALVARDRVAGDRRACDDGSCNAAEQLRPTAGHRGESQKPSARRCFRFMIRKSRASKTMQRRITDCRKMTSDYRRK